MTRLNLNNGGFAKWTPRLEFSPLEVSRGLEKEACGDLLA